MSGGSMDYLYQRVDDAVFDTSTPERAAFAEHLKMVAKALHDIEWVDSGDYGEGDDTEAIMRCITPSDVLDAATNRANEALAQLQDTIDRYNIRGGSE